MNPTPSLDRLLAKVVQGECWIWIGAVTSSGTPSCSFQGRGRSARQVFYGQFVGGIPEGLVVVPMCGQPLCLRPEHLQAATRSEVASRFKSRGERFWAKVEKGSACWLWTGAVNTSGYGVMGDYRGWRELAHRYSYQIHIGPIRVGHYVCHRCDVRACVHPDHLFEGTPKENNLDALKKGRNLSWLGGENHPAARFTELQAREILRRAKAGEKQVDLAVEFGVSSTTISSLVRGLRWRCLHSEERPWG